MIGLNERLIIPYYTRESEVAERANVGQVIVIPWVAELVVHANYDGILAGDNQTRTSCDAKYLEAALRQLLANLVIWRIVLQPPKVKRLSPFFVRRNAFHSGEIQA
jgi:hypothetical protein